MKKPIIMVALLALMLSCFTLGTAAYFSQEARTTNVVTKGSVVIDLSDILSTQTIELLGNTDIVIMPGVSVAASPCIENIGISDFYTRAKIETTIRAYDGSTLLSTEVVTFDIDSSAWIYDADGYYRYVGIVQSGDENSIPIFDNISFSPQMGNEYINATITVTIHAQAVQVQNNLYSPNDAAQSVLDVQGWPESENFL